MTPLVPTHHHQADPDLGNVGLGSQADHDVQLLQFDIDGVVVLHKEHLHLMLQDLRPGRQGEGAIKGDTRSFTLTTET